MNSQGNNEDTLDDKDINTFEESSRNKDLNLESNASDEKRQRMTTPPPTTTSSDATTFNVPGNIHLKYWHSYGQSIELSRNLLQI